MRRSSKKILFVVSTGKTWIGMMPNFPSSWLKKKDVEIFGLTIGPSEDALDQLKEIVSAPVETHTFWVKKLQDIRPLLTMLKGKGEFMQHYIQSLAITYPVV